MAGSSSVIGALRIVLGLDSASLETGLKKAQSSLTGFSNAAKITGGVIAGALAGAIAGIGVSIKGAIDEAAKMSKLAQSVGVPIEELTALKFAAQLSGIEIETLAKSMGILSKNMVTAAAGADQMDVKGGKAAGAFKALGIEVKNATSGELKSSTEIMTEVAAKFEGMQDGAGKTALAMMIFGKSGAALIPMLNKGADGLKEMMAEAEKLGLVLDTGTGQAAVQFNNTLLRMSKIKEGMWQVIAEKMLPAFQTFANILLEGRQNSNLMSVAAEGIVTVLRSLVSAAIVSVTALGNIGRALVALKTLAADLLAANIFNPAEFSAAFAKFDAVVQDNTARMAASMGVVKRVWQDVNTQFQNSPGALAPLVESVNKAKNALDSFLASQAKQLAGHQAEALTIGMLVGARERLKIQLEGAAIAQANNIIMTDKQRVALEAAAIAAGNMALKIAGLKLTDELLLPWEEFNKKLDTNRLLFEAGAISIETYGRANRRVAEQAAATWDIAGASIAGSFATIAGSFGESNSAMATAAKAFAIVNAVISTYTGMAKALELPFPANLAAVAVVAAKGFAFVAAIQSQAVPKFAQGADFMVGGMGGLDRNRITMDLTRGERVRVDPAGSPAATAASGERKVVQVRGVSTKEWFRGDVVRDSGMK